MDMKIKIYRTKLEGGIISQAFMGNRKVSRSNFIGDIVTLDKKKLLRNEAMLRKYAERKR